MPHDFSQAPSYCLADDLGNMSEPFRAVRDGGGFVAEDGRVFEGAAFAELAMRCDADGETIVGLDEPLYQQGLAIRRAVLHGAPGMDAHVEDLRVLRELAGPVDAHEGHDRLDLQTHDLLETGLSENVAFGAEAAARERASADAQRRIEAARDHYNREGEEEEAERDHGGDEQDEHPDAVLARIQADTGIDAGSWHNVSEYPTYQMEPIRAAARQMLAPILGKDVALEDLRRLQISKEDAASYQAVLDWTRESGEAREYPPFRHPQMRGYVTSDVTYGEVNGVAMLVFSDFMAHYAYAWQANPERKPSPEEDAGPRP